ncbi:FeoA family protein [Hathewaya limosa]|uniref:Ferrous iron transport protein A n=1 Tax=Hathewaya limosa TaxID=1536 RepID=A0ABU0JQK1_HATLI|nr:FeoA family protein [Hathewaya limosa]AWZ48062.1 ferrous iron transport protein A [Clostridiaceae bacterium 14S0207]MDQ0479374.1 ferrous iron transport protein A [Hathewaya limosa]
MELCLDKCKVGNEYEVLNIKEGSRVRRRIMDLGIVKGTKVKVTGKAPLGDPIEIALRGYKLTLRKEEAKDIIVK